MTHERTREKRILHLDMDAFFASVEQAANPALRGKPLIVGGRENRKRTVVCAASYEAKRMGIDSGMSCQEAFRLCPGAEFAAADSAKYLYVSREIYNLLEKYSPQVEQASVDEFYLDVTGCDRFFGGYQTLAAEIKQEINAGFGITGSIGISLNRLMSKIASKLEKPDGLVVLEEKDIDARLADLPVETIPGIGKSLTRHLRELSIVFFKDLRRPSKRFFLERFGRLGLWMYSAAHPREDETPIEIFRQKTEPPKSVGHSYTLPRNIYKEDEIRSWIHLLCEMVGFRLRRLRLESSILHLYLRRPDMEFAAKEKNFRDYTNDSDIIYRRALYIRESLSARSSAVRALGVCARGLAPAAGRYLFPEQNKRSAALAARDKINERFGDWTIYPAAIIPAAPEG